MYLLMLLKNPRVTMGAALLLSLAVLGVYSPLQIEEDPAPVVPTLVPLTGSANTLVNSTDSALNIDIPQTYRFYVDDNAQLYITEDIKDIFDYFLIDASEATIATKLALIEQYIKQQLQGAAQLTALDLLARYVDMKRALIDFEQSHPRPRLSDPVGLQEYIASRNSLMQSYIGVEYYDALFGDAHTHDDYTLGRLNIMADNSTDAEQKQQQLALHDQAYTDITAVSQSAQKHLRLKAEEKTLLNDGASKDDIYAYRTATVGANAAERLAKLDIERAQWQQRLVVYHAQKSKIQQSRQFSDSQKDHLIGELKQSSFTPLELKRVLVQ